MQRSRLRPAPCASESTVCRRYLSQIGLRSWFSSYCGGASCYGNPAVSPPVCTHKCGSKVRPAVHMPASHLVLGSAFVAWQNEAVAIMVRC